MRLSYEGRLIISNETIYRFIWLDKLHGGRFICIYASPKSRKENGIKAPIHEVFWLEKGRYQSVHNMWGTGIR